MLCLTSYQYKTIQISIHFFIFASMNNKKRVTIIVISLSIGTILSALMLISHYKTANAQLMGNIFVNLLFSVAVVVGIAFLFSKMNKKKK